MKSKPCRASFAWMMALATLFSADLLFSVKVRASDGLVHVAAEGGVTEVSERLQAELDKRGLKLFTVVDHHAGASAAGFEIREMQLVIFGNPKVGTPLIQCAPTMGLDLPMKMLVWEDLKGSVWVSYNDMEWLDSRHDLSLCRPVVEKVSGVLATIAGAVATP